MCGSPNIYLMHHGIKGMHWGIRRYQNPDGSLTKSGKHRYSSKTSNSSNSKNSKTSIAKKVALGTGIATAAYLGAGYGIGLKEETDRGKKIVLDKYKNNLSDFNETDRNKIAKTIARKTYNNRFKYDFQNIVQKTKNAGYHTKHKVLSKVAPTKPRREAHALIDRLTDAKPIKFNNKNDINWYDYSKENVINYIDEQRRKLKHDDIYSSYLAHHGIKGMHWGVRRFEDSSGHLTPAGKKRYDKYYYSAKSASVGKRKGNTPLSKKAKLIGKKVALAGGLALGAYGTSQILKNKKAIGDISSQIESKHGSELEGLDPKKRQKILKRVSKEQKYERDRIEKLRKSKDPNDQKKAESGSRILNDDYISSRINKMKPKNLRTKQPKQPRQQKQAKSTEKKETNWQWSKVRESKKKPGQASDETISIRNANRIESLYRKRYGGTSTKTPSTPKEAVTRTETREKAERPTKASKTPQSKIDTKTKIKVGKTALSTSKALLTKDYATAIYNTSETLIESTNKLIEQFKDHRV